MFRQSVRRCAGLASGAASRSVRLPSRLACSSISQSTTSFTAHRINASLASRAARLYSSLAEATEQSDPSVDHAAGAASPNQTARFSDLEARGIHPNLLRAITQDMGYDTMTAVQDQTITPALGGTDIVAQAKTGTGKTLAFLLPLMQRMIAEDPTLGDRRSSRNARADDIRGIVLSPTRELAEQIAEEARRLVKHTGLVVQSAVGGTRKSEMLRQTRHQGCHLLVATPGRLNDILQDEHSGIAAPNLAAMVLDEADRMLDVGFEKELHEIIRCLPKPEEKVRQTMLVSATIPDDVIRLARSMVRPQDFKFVQTIAENDSLTHEKVPQHVVGLKGWSNVFPSLFELFDREHTARQTQGEYPFKAIVYFNTTAMVQLAGELGYVRRTNQLTEIRSYSIHSQLSQQQRTKAAEMFRNSRSGVLFSSDVTARGMDFPNVTHVIQVDLAQDRESYIHRLGRTGRQDKAGEGWLFLPEASTRNARRMLNGLPLKKNDSLTSAQASMEDAQDSDFTPHQRQVKEMAPSLPAKMVRMAYMSVFGKSADKNSLAEDLRVMMINGFGMAEVPTVSRSWADRMAISPRVVNIGNTADLDDDSRGGSMGYRSRFGGSDGPRRFDSSSRSSDPFSSMARDARRDDHRGSSGGHGGFQRRDGGFQRRDGGGSGRGGFQRRDGGGRGGYGGDGGRSSRYGGDGESKQRSEW